MPGGRAAAAAEAGADRAVEAAGAAAAAALADRSPLHHMGRRALELYAVDNEAPVHFGAHREHLHARWCWQGVPAVRRAVQSAWPLHCTQKKRWRNQPVLPS